MLLDALAVTDRSIASNKRADGLFHAYNIADFDGERLGVDHLYPMLEGQVAALSSGAVPAGEAVDVLEALYESAIYRADQDSFMLYPDRKLPGFLERNRVPEQRAMSIPLRRVFQSFSSSEGKTTSRWAHPVWRTWPSWAPWSSRAVIGRSGSSSTSGGCTTGGPEGIARHSRR